MGIHADCRSKPPKGLQGFWRKGERWLRFVGFKGFMLNIVDLNRPSANLMPISQKRRASLVNSPFVIKLPQISQNMPRFSTLRRYLSYARISARCTQAHTYTTRITHITHTKHACIHSRIMHVAPRISRTYTLRITNLVTQSYATWLKALDTGVTASKGKLH